MTKSQKYEIVLLALAEKLQEKDTTILLQGFEIEKLKKQLAEAESHYKQKTVKLEIRKEL